MKTLVDEMPINWSKKTHTKPWTEKEKNMVSRVGDGSHNIKRFEKTPPST